MSQIFPLTVTAAITAAAVANVPCCVVQWLILDERPLRVTVATTDPDPTVSVAIDSRPGLWLDHREPSAPDRWDYHTEFTGCRTVTGLRIGRPPHVADIPLLSAEFAVMSVYGWGDHLALPVEALVDGAAFQLALKQQLQLCGDR